MKGDFTRDTFDRAKHYSRVLMQQGRVTLDADHNEQTDIILHYLRTLARDLIGPYAAPVGENSGFKLSPEDHDLLIGAGRYYVDGILVENDNEKCLYSKQPHYPLPDNDALREELNHDTNKVFGVYLDVWERHITSIEDDGIREKALNGPDTCTRAQIVWQVKALDTELESPPADPFPMRCEDLLRRLVTVSKSRLAARVDPGKRIEDPCETPPDSKYRGKENQLYRVEIHNGGKPNEATFTWSHDNGSIATAWLGTSGNDLQVSHGRGFAAGNWVELIDDTLELQGKPGVLVKLTKVEGSTLSMDPGASSNVLPWSQQLVNPKVRRWDQTDNKDLDLVQGAVPVKEGNANEPLWIDLEDGVQIAFSRDTEEAEYRTGDYWLIPARVATGELEWHVSATGPVARKPEGIEHHYAPLGFVWWKDDGELAQESCHREFTPLGSVAAGEPLPGPENFAVKPVPNGPDDRSKKKTPRRKGGK